MEAVLIEDRNIVIVDAEHYKELVKSMELRAATQHRYYLKNKARLNKARVERRRHATRNNELVETAS